MATRENGRHPDILSLLVHFLLVLPNLTFAWSWDHPLNEGYLVPLETQSYTPIENKHPSAHDRIRRSTEDVDQAFGDTAARNVLFWQTCSDQSSKIVTHDQLLIISSRPQPDDYSCVQKFSSLNASSVLVLHCYSLYLRFNCKFESLTVKTDFGRHLICRCYDGPNRFLSRTIEIHYHRRLFGAHGGYTCTLTAAPAIKEKVSKPTCGVSKLQEDEKLRSFVAPRVINGKDTRKNAFPWMVILRVFRGSSMTLCGGTLISDDVVITAAHCIGKNVDRVKVGLGKQNRTQAAEEGSIWMTTTNFVSHPDHNAIQVEADIGAVFLPSKVTFNDYIRPICLPNTNIDDVIGGEEVTAIGWGATKFEGNFSETLQQVALTVVPQGECEANWDPHGFTLKNSHICAIERNKDTCKGDSGGPLMAKIDDIWTFIGITSFGYECATPGLPAIYTRISSYMDWIEKFLFD